MLPDDVAPVHRLVADVIAGTVDAVTFTSAPAATSLLSVAAEEGRQDGLVAALRERVTAVAVGPVTAAPLDAVGIPSFRPQRARLGDLAREVVARLPERDPVLEAGPHTLQVRGHAAVLDGRLVGLAPDPMAVLRALTRAPGHVVPQADLVAALPDGGGEHAVRTAVARLRTVLGASLVETVGEDSHRLAT